MGTFPDRLLLSPVGDGVNWTVEEDFRRYDNILGLITVPKDFVTDGASIPKILQNIFSPWGKYGPAAVIHDWLYTFQKFTQKESDDCLLRGMIDLRVPKLTRFTIWIHLRMWGWIVWAQHRRELQKKNQA